MAEARGILAVERCELAYSVTLHRPAFELPMAMGRLQSEVFARLAEFGLTPTQIKIESTSPNPSDLAIAFWLRDWAGVVRYRLTSLEFWTNKPQIAPETEAGTSIVVRSVEALRAVVPAVALVSQRVSAAVHGHLAGRLTEEWLHEYSGEFPSGPSPMLPTGVSFETSLEAGTGTLVFEKSNFVPKGVFLRVTGDFSGDVDQKTVIRRWHPFFVDVLGRLGVSSLKEKT